MRASTICVELFRLFLASWWLDHFHFFCFQYETKLALLKVNVRLQIAELQSVPIAQDAHFAGM